MKKLARRFALTAVCVGFFTGCATIGNAPVMAPITLNEKGPVAAGSATGSAKVGRSEAWGILVFATGDASISTAMKNLNQVAQQNLMATRQIEQAAQNLNALGTKLAGYTGTK